MNSGISTYRRCSKSPSGHARHPAVVLRTAAADTVKRARTVVRAAAVAEALEPRRLLATFTVTTATDTVDPADGVLSLREAIVESNTLPGIDRIEFNIAGDGPHVIRPTTMLPSILTGCVLDARTQPGYTGAPLVQIDGALAPSNADGLRVGSLGSQISGLSITRFGAQGMQITALANQNVVFANYIGVEPDGVTAAPNARGILLSGFNNVIGGATPAERNVISGNAAAGIQLNGNASDNNNVRGNFIGTDATGSAAIGNGTAGILLSNGPDFNVIGANGDGVNDAGERNVISGNKGEGVRIGDVGTSANIVAGNYIGTDATGAAALGNASWGVLTEQSSDNQIGRDNDSIADATEGNLISGNASGGVLVAEPSSFSSTFSVPIVGNLIGTDVSGTAALGNGGPGVRIEGAVSSSGVFYNTIRHNAGDGIVLAPSANGRVPRSNHFNRNSIDANGGIGIDLGGDGVTPNDYLDADDGPNGLTNAPTILGWEAAGPGDVLVHARLHAAPFNYYSIEFFATPAGAAGDVPEAARYLGNASAVADENGSVALHVTVSGSIGDGEIITATANDLFNSGTGELSGRVTADAGGPYVFVEGDGATGGVREIQLQGVALDLGGDAVTWAWDLDNDGEFDDSTALNPTIRLPDDGPVDQTASLRVTNSAGQTSVSTTSVRIANVAPSVVVFSTSGTESAPIASGKPAVISGQFTDPGLLDTQVINIDWGDGTYETMEATRPAGAADGAFCLSHTYAAGGVYSAVFGVVDDEGWSSSYNAVSVYVSGASIQSGTLYVVGTDKADNVTLTGHDDGSISVATSFLSAPLEFAAGEFFSINVFLAGKSDHATATGMIYNLAIEGGEGNDVIQGADAGGSLVGGPGSDTITGGPGTDYLMGGVGNDVLDAGKTSEPFSYDVLYGDSGNDTFIVRSGLVYAYGGPGNDIYTGTADSTGSFYGEGGNDKATGGSGPDYFAGGEGNDKLDGAGGEDGLYGEAGDDTLRGGDGSDGLGGGTGNDRMEGGAGADTYYFDSAFDGAEADIVQESNGPAENTLHLGIYDPADGVVVDLTRSGTGAFYHRNGSRTVHLTGGSTFHRIFGGAGDDLLTGNDADNYIDGGEGNDVIFGNGGNDEILAGYYGDNEIHGGAGNDSIYGGGGNDRLFGDDGDDLLYGGWAADTIDGGDGTDALIDPGDPADILTSIELP